MSDLTSDSVIFRPVRLIFTAAVFSGTLVILCAVGWILLPAHLKAGFTGLQLATLVLILGALIFVMVALAASSVRADAQGLRIRNALRTYDVPWMRVHKIMLRRGDPWALVLLKPADGRPFEVDLDADKRQLMGIQRSEGIRAQRAVEDLRQRHRSAIERGD